MAIPYTFARVKPQDFTLTPFPTYKRYIVSSSEMATTASGYILHDGVHSSLKTPIGSTKADNDPINSSDNSYQHVIWSHIDLLWYKFPYDSMATLEHANRRYTYKNLNYSASQLSIPYLKFGEAIKNTSVSLNNSTYNYRLIDDPNGNLYDPTIVTSSYANLHSLVAYWGFNEAFKKFKYCEGTTDYGSIGYTSRTFTPDNHSVVSNVYFTRGVNVNNTPSGMSANFNGASYIITDDRPEFNFPTNEDFTLSTWVKIPVSQSVLTHDTNTIISKRGMINKRVYGIEEKYNQSNQIVSTAHISSSLVNEDIDIYPFDIDVYNTGANNGKVRFRRSDGSNVVSLLSTGSLNDGRDHHIAVTKQGAVIKLYVDGTVNASGSEVKYHPINKHQLMFGATNIYGKQGFSGSIDEIRLYEYGATSSSIQTLADNISGSLYQTAIVGNVFYRSGNIIVSPLNPKYQNALKGNFTLAYRGTHTIYQYEAMVRIKAGSFNVTLNQSARLSPKSDLLIDAFTSSASLLNPYFTEIGLYNGKGDLLVVAKMARPIQVRDDVDINVRILFDA